MIIQRHELLENPLHKCSLYSGASKINCLIDEQTVCTAVQVLQPNQSTSLLDDASVSMRLNCVGRNSYELNILKRQDGSQSVLLQASISPVGITVTTDKEPQLDCMNFLRFLAAQMNPYHTHAQDLVKRISATEGSFFSSLPLSSDNIQVSTQFRKDNATVVSKFKDLLTSGKHKCSVAYANKLSFLAALSCACSTADNLHPTLLSISQGTCNHPPVDFFNMLYTHAPIKQNLTILTRKDTTHKLPSQATRYNLAVRMFARDHEVTRAIERLCTPLNSTIDSGIMVVSGVHDNHAAVVYLNAQSQSPSRLNALMCKFLA